MSDSYTYESPLETSGPGSPSRSLLCPLFAACGIGFTHVFTGRRWWCAPVLDLPPSGQQDFPRIPFAPLLFQLLVGTGNQFFSTALQGRCFLPGGSGLSDDLLEFISSQIEPASLKMNPTFMIIFQSGVIIIFSPLQASGIMIVSGPEHMQPTFLGRILCYGYLPGQLFNHSRVGLNTVDDQQTQKGRKAEDTPADSPRGSSHIHIHIGGRLKNAEFINCRER